MGLKLASLAKIFSEEKSFDLIKGFCEKNFKKVGFGTTRVVYKAVLDDATVAIKLSHGGFWTEANDKEIKIYRKTNGNTHLAKVLAYNNGNLHSSWLIAEFIPRLFTQAQASLVEDCAYYGNRKPPERYEKFISFLVEQKLTNDLHRKNLGFRADKTPVILDYGA